MTDHDIMDEQSKLWNGPAGRTWVAEQELLDRVLAPFKDLLVDAVAARSPHQVLDVGCGTGATTLAIARQLGPDGRCTGVDISEPMIAAARARAEREHSTAHFISGNAQTYAFAPGAFDMIVSRFGVMFFEDPVRAFTNLRHAATADARLTFIAWRSAVENAFMTTAERTAAPLLPDLPPRRPDGPGQFAFGDGNRIRTILEQSGWLESDVRPIDVECRLPEADLDRYVTRLGPVGLALQEADDPTRARVGDALRAAFAPFVMSYTVRFVAACWIVGARASADQPISPSGRPR